MGFARTYAAQSMVLRNSSRSTRNTRMASGFDDWDQITQGLSPANLIIVAGRPGMGKTSSPRKPYRAIFRRRSPVALRPLRRRRGPGLQHQEGQGSSGQDTGLVVDQQAGKDAQHRKARGLERPAFRATPAAPGNAEVAGCRTRGRSHRRRELSFLTDRTAWRVTSPARRLSAEFGRSGAKPVRTVVNDRRCPHRNG